MSFYLNSPAPRTHSIDLVVKSLLTQPSFSSYLSIYKYQDISSRTHDRGNLRETFALMNIGYQTNAETAGKQCMHIAI